MPNRHHPTGDGWTSTTEVASTLGGAVRAAELGVDQIAVPSSPPSSPAGLSPGSRTVLESAMDAVVMIDQQGRVVFWNPAAATMFGRSAGEVLGRDMAELIIPPSLRRRHRDALRRSGLPAEHSILGRRIEVTGQRRDGSVFPVELTITGTDLDGTQLFTGYLRDITERRRLLADVQESRARLVAVSDQTRRTIERDLHDGVQQQLVGAAMAVANAQASLTSEPAVADAMLQRATRVLMEAITDIRELARGVLPTVLTDHGLRPALADLARRSPIPVEVEAVDERWPATVETSLYFLASEALTNAAKHGAGNVRVDLSVESLPSSQIDLVPSDQERVSLVCRVVDDGPGGADATKGSGLQGLQDRLAAVGGTLSVDSPSGRGTRLTGRVPVPTTSVPTASVPTTSIPTGSVPTGSGRGPETAGDDHRDDR